MHLFNGRPEITAKDHPVTIYAALLGSIAIYNREMPEDTAFAWVKTAQDAYEAVQDGFGIDDTSSEPQQPNGSALLYMSLDQLEFALVGYGSRVLENSEETAHVEASKINQLLESIDSLRAEQH